MQCKELLALLNDYVDGDLAQELNEAFREHLCGCSSCEVVLDNIQHTITVYKAGQPVELPDAIQKQLRGILRERWDTMFPSVEQ